MAHLAPTTAGGEQRLRYATTHWAREEDEQRALDQYLQLGGRVYNRTKSKLFMSMTGTVKGKKILDYGGGAGILAIPYAKAGAEVTLVDAEANALRTARFYAHQEGVADRLHTIQAESFPESLKSEVFDIVIAKDVVEHVPDDEGLLRDLSECQRHSSVFLLSTQNQRSLNYLLEGGYQKYWRHNTKWCGWDETHLRFYTSSSLKRKLRQAGYKADRWASVYVIPYGILAWLTLFKASIELPSLRFFDLTAGRWPPFNRLGWNIIVRSTKL